VILAGTGVRAAGAVAVFERVIRKLHLPVTTAWTHDLIASDDELFCGRPGTIGERAGNFTVQNSDVLLVLGSRLNIRQVSYNWPSFARNAFKIQVDVDAAELDKPTVSPNLPIHCDLNVFLQELERQVEESWSQRVDHAKWLDWCRERVTRYPVVRGGFMSRKLPRPIRLRSSADRHSGVGSKTSISDWARDVRTASPDWPLRRSFGSRAYPPR
jgi:acetolactate synthase I/II/III large subunit